MWYKIFKRPQWFYLDRIYFKGFIKLPDLYENVISREGENHLCIDNDCYDITDGIMFGGPHYLHTKRPILKLFMWTTRYLHVSMLKSLRIVRREVTPRPSSERVPVTSPKQRDRDSFVQNSSFLYISLSPFWGPWCPPRFGHRRRGFESNVDVLSQTKD